jgi:hypothetical protein
MLNRTQPRDVLRAAIDEREGRQRRVDAASATLACADDLRREALCQAELAEVEEAIISHRADAMRAWAASPDREKPSMAVPESLIARRRACAEARESAAAAASARKALSDELDEAKSALADAERSAREAALAIVLGEAERIASQLDAAKRETWDLSNKLRGFGRLWVPTGPEQTPKPVRLPPQVQAALDAQEPQHPPLMNPETKHAAAWRAYHAALLADPEATFGGAS